MKLSLTTNNTTHSVESEYPWDINEITTQFKGLLVSAGFHPECVDKYFDTEDKWFAQSDESDDEDQQSRAREFQEQLYQQTT